MLDQKILALLRKYLNNECSDDEITSVEEILKSGKYTLEWQEVIEEDAINSFEREEFIPLNKRMSILSKIDQTIAEKTVTTKSKIWRQVLKVAASIVLISMIGASFYLFNKSEAKYAVVVTDTFSKKKVVLPDGSEVWINKKSEIKHALQFSATREVYLKGEAFFKVVKDPSKPFIVHAGSLQTVVLGTSFNINASSDNVLVTVMTGKVKVIGPDNHEKEIAALLPGQQLTYKKESREHVVKKVVSEEVLVWKDELMRFDNVPMKDVAIRLEQYYGVKIHLEEQIKDCKVKVSFKNESLPEVLRVIQIIAEVNFKIRDKEVFLSGKGCD
jgi:transmembrane sensor